MQQLALLLFQFAVFIVGSALFSCEAIAHQSAVARIDARTMWLSCCCNDTSTDSFSTWLEIIAAMCCAQSLYVVTVLLLAQL